MRYFLVDKTVFDNNRVGMYGKLIYAILCKFLNADGTCFPSRKTISKCGNFSISTYNKYVSVMLLENVLEKKIRVRKNGSQTSNLFKLKRIRKIHFLYAVIYLAKDYLQQRCVYIFVWQDMWLKIIVVGYRSI